MNDEYKQEIKRRIPRAQLSLVLSKGKNDIDIAVSIHSIYRICITLYCKAHCFILIVCNAYIRTMTYYTIYESIVKSDVILGCWTVAR